MSDETRLIEVTTELIDTFGGRTLDGRRLSYEWGRPTGHDPDGDRYVYTPTVTATDDGMVVVELAEVERLRAVEEAASDLMDYHDGGGFRANHPDDLFSALRTALVPSPAPTPAPETDLGRIVE